MQASTPIFCPDCDYNLTGLELQRCPECGAAFDPDALHRAARLARLGARRRLWPVLILPLAAWVFAAGAFAAAGRQGDLLLQAFALLTLTTVPLTFILGLYIAHKLGRTLALLALGWGWLASDRASLRSGAWLGGLVLFLVQVAPVLAAGITMLVLLVDQAMV